MAKSICSLASPNSCASSISSSCSSSSSGSSSSSSISSSSKNSSSDKSLGLKSSSSIDRRKRLAANARERKRMHLLNKAYDELRRRLVDAENKSKYDVLVQAKEYIQALATICEKFDQQDSQQQATPIVVPESPQQRQQEPIQPLPPPPPPPLPVHNIKIQSTPVDMSYNPIQENHHFQVHYQPADYYTNLDSPYQKTPIQLYQHQHMNAHDITFR